MARRILLVAFGLLPANQAEPLADEFVKQLRCPFAKVWLEHGPERAAEILGVAPHANPGQRRLSSAWGTCTYNNQFSGQTVCMEFHGPSWDSTTAATRCSNAMPGTAGTLAEGASCTTTADLAGWCMTNGGAERTPMDITAQASTCGEVAQSCQTWSQGTFSFAGRCAQPPAPVPNSTNGTSGGPPPGVSGGGPPGGAFGGGGGGPPVKCMIAPGAIGAAHQMGFSPGYDFNCVGTPAQQSPYMWPLRWTALVEQKGLAFRSDVPTYESKGRVYYMLDRNWKRLDTWYQSGVQRAVGQGPCENPINGTDLACDRTSSRNTTMLHRGNKMVFIDWAANGTIESCSWLDMAVVGNIRPDWFMDDRGDSTDVQYIGDSHVYYLGEPRLVKQWRKKDFANQYFTMSMQRLPGADGVHWPLILNIPGEGFGDDFLQHWHGHRVLNESETALFLLDEEHVQNGGSCPKRPSVGGGGPPTGQVAHVPSNLEVDPVSWNTVVYTASPIWTPPAPSGPSSSSGLAQELDTGIEATSCYDGAASSLRFSVSFDTATPVWAAIGFRQTEECLMTPRGGGDGEIVFTQPDSNSAYQVHYGPLSPDTKHFQVAAIGGLVQGLTAIGQASGFGSSTVEYSNGKLVLGFTRSYPSMPSSFNLSYALGATQQVGYHSKRGCFKVTPTPCPTVCLLNQGNQNGGNCNGNQNQGNQNPGAGNAIPMSNSVLISGVPHLAIFTTLLLACFAVGQSPMP